MESLRDFISTRKDRWRLLEDLLAKKKRSFEEVMELGKLYQRAADDLSHCGTRYGENGVTEYLNQLVRKCHTAFYRPEKIRLSGIAGFFTRRFPALLYRLRYAILASTAVFSLSIFASFLMVSNNVVLGEIFLPDRMYDMAVRDLELRTQFSNFDNIPDGMRTALSLYVWFNNSMVSVYCFALGITFGLGTLFILVRNGFMLGALMAIYFMNGHFLDFFSIIMVHGSLELPAIVIAAGAGLSIGTSLVYPRRLPRIMALKESAKNGLMVLGGVIALLLAAGLIEGLITPMKLPVEHRLIIMSVNVLLLALYAARGVIRIPGRNSPPGG